MKPIAIPDIKVVQRSMYEIKRHGRTYYRRTLEAAINKMAHIMTQKVFTFQDIPFNEPDTSIYVDGELSDRRGELTERYRSAHKRCIRRMLKIVEIKKTFNNACWEQDKAEDEYHASVDKLKLARHEVDRLKQRYK